MSILAVILSMDISTFLIKMISKIYFGPKQLIGHRYKQLESRKQRCMFIHMFVVCLFTGLVSGLTKKYATTTTIFRKQTVFNVLGYVIITFVVIRQLLSNLQSLYICCSFVRNPLYQEKSAGSRCRKLTASCLYIIHIFGKYLYVYMSKLLEGEDNEDLVKYPVFMFLSFCLMIRWGGP